MVILIAMWSSLLIVEAVFVNHDIPVNDMYLDGDLIIGGLISTRRSNNVKICGEALYGSYIQIAHSVKYVIEQVNKNPNILPGIKLGLANLDYCSRSSIALARSTSFLPRARACKRNTCGAPAVNWTVDMEETGLPNYDVIGVIGTAGSHSSSMVTGLLEVYKVPLISYIASSDDLSVPVKLGYFARTVPPDSYQAKAIASILANFNWTYIALIGQEGSYSGNLNKYIRQWTERHGICVGHEANIHTESVDAKFDELVRDLVKQKKAKVVVLTISPTSITQFGKAMIRAGVQRNFILVATDTFTSSVVAAHIEDFPLVLATRPKEAHVPEFQEYYKSLPIFNDDTADPWLGQYEKKRVGCVDVATNTSSVLCSSYKDATEIPGFSWSSYYAKAMDAALVYIMALDSYVNDNCKNFTGDRDALMRCINRDLYMAYIRNVSFQGYSQYIKYDPETYEIISSYDVLYYGRDSNGNVMQREILLGNWTNDEHGLRVDESLVYWNNTVNFTKDEKGYPESVCAKPCQEREYYVKGELPCCWICHACRENEVVREDGQGCLQCPLLHWPKGNGSECQEIPPTYMHWSDSLAIGLVNLTSLGIVTIISLAVIFVYFRNKKVIRGSSRELMVIVMFGVFLSFLTVFSLLTKPSNWACYTYFFTFHISCTCIFGPMFLKTVRMRRIFLAAERCELRIRLVNEFSQVVMALMIVGIQVASCIIIAVFSPPRQVLQMPVETVRFVELTCSMPLLNLYLPLSINLCLLLLCSILGFLTRKLPENYNESWHIFISVVTTLFLWVAFIPTYLLAFYAYHKASLLSLALILTGFVTSLCFLVPKAYAALFVDNKLIKTSNFDSSRFEHSTNRSSKLTEATPVPSGRPSITSSDKMNMSKRISVT